MKRERCSPVSSLLDLRSFHTASDVSVSDTAISRRTAMVWCVQNSKTYIVIELGRLVAGESVPSTISIAYNVIKSHVSASGDGPVHNGRYSMVGFGGVAVNAWNANNHQLSWGVLSAALTAVLDYMRIFGNGATTFNIFDGSNMVGQGTVNVPT